MRRREKGGWLSDEDARGVVAERDDGRTARRDRSDHVDSCLHQRTDGTEDDAFLGTGGELGIRARGARDARDDARDDETETFDARDEDEDEDEDDDDA